MRSNLVRGALVCALLVIFVMAPGCSSGANFPTTIAGDWQWTNAVFNCPILAGILDTLQTFTIVQVGSSIDGNGATISASFTDTNGNDVTITGTYVVDRMEAFMVVLDVGNRRIEAELSYFARDEGNGVRTLDGTIRITFDSDDTCTGQTVGGWLKSMTAPPAEIPGQQLIVADLNGDIWGLDQQTGEETFLCNTFQLEGQEPGDVGVISSMLYRADTNELVVGMGNDSFCSGCYGTLNTASGEVQPVSQPSGRALPGLTLFNGFAFSVEGGDNELIAIETDGDFTNRGSVTGLTSFGGNGLTTTLGGTIYLGAGERLYTLNQITGQATPVAPSVNWVGFPGDLDTEEARLTSMTTRQDGQIFGIVKDTFRDSVTFGRTWLARVDPTTTPPTVTNIRQNSREFDGIAIVPTGLFMKDCPLELVFLLDTTLPTDDLLDICDGILDLEAELNMIAMEGSVEGIPFTPDFRLEIYAILNGDGTCADGDLIGRFGNPIVPGTSRRLDHAADTGDGAAVVAGLFDWQDTENPFRVVIPVTYMAPQDGGMLCDSADQASADNAIAQALANNVFILPVLLEEADECVFDLAEQTIMETSPSLQNLPEFLEGDFEPPILEDDEGRENIRDELLEGIVILWAVNCGLIDDAIISGPE